MAVKKLENLLNSGSSSTLENIIQTAQKMQSLTAALRAEIEPELADHLLAANVREDGELVVICRSSAWAARLRFEAETLLRAAHEAGHPAESVRVSVSQG